MRSFLCAAALVASVLHASDPNPLPDGLYAQITTPHGTFIAALDFETAPLTVTSFVGLAEGKLGSKPGQPYFDGLTFHRVVPGFVIQGGDPLGDGEGGPGYEFPDEFSPALKHNRKGTLSMANSGPDTNGSQFFITLDSIPRLDYLHSVFGQVIDGLEVLDQIQSGDTMSVQILRYGSAARAFVADQAAFDALIADTPKAQPPHLDDPDGLMPGAPTNWPRIYDHKLANFARFTGEAIYLKLVNTRGSMADSPDHEGLSAALARRAGLTVQGIAAVYIADSNLWELTLAPDTAVRLLLPDETLSALKQRILSAAADQAAAGLAARTSTRPMTPDRHIMNEVNSLINELIALLERNPQS